MLESNPRTGVVVNEAGSNSTPIRLNPGLDPQLISRVYRATGRVHIPDFFEPTTAARIHHCIANETPWQYVLFDGKENLEMTVASLAELAETDRARVLTATDRVATRDFSYRYANFRIFENWERGLHGDSFLMRVLEFLNGPEFIALMRGVTGDATIDYADAQATLYRSGDFLSCHNDNVAGKNRRVAYVLNFTPEWRPDWGGLLAFPDRFGHLSEAYTPAFNALNLFRVPMLHSVTQLSSFAAAPRYSITGWLRHRPAPA